MSLTLKQKRFADFYIECGNASEAARLAGYSEKSAGSIGNENLQKQEIRDYIDERLLQLQGEMIADQREILTTLTGLMRSSERDSDRLKAAELLMKKYNMFTLQEEIDNSTTIEVCFVENGVQDG